MLSLFLFLSAAFAALPAREGFVTDGPDLIPAEVQVSLERELAGYNERTGFDVAVLVVDTLSGQDVCEFATAVRKDWSLGGPDKNGTLYVVVPPPEKKACIATGPGARVYMSDTEATKIVEEVAKPLNLRDRRVDAIVAATDAIVTALGDTPVADRPAPPEPAQPFVDHSSSAKQEDTDAVVILLWITGAILLVIFLVWLLTLSGRRGRGGYYSGSSTYIDSSTTFFGGGGSWGGGDGGGGGGDGGGGDGGGGGGGDSG